MSRWIRGAEAAAPFASEVDFPVVVDQAHSLGELLGVVNVPSGIWVDEDGTVVRPPETACPARPIALFRVSHRLRRTTGPADGRPGPSPTRRRARPRSTTATGSPTSGASARRTTTPRWNWSHAAGRRSRHSARRPTRRWRPGARRGACAAPAPRWSCASSVLRFPGPGILVEGRGCRWRFDPPRAFQTTLIGCSMPLAKGADNLLHFANGGPRDGPRPSACQPRSCR